MGIIYNEDCFFTMQNRIKKHSINVILTSPPYNTSRLSNNFYDEYADNKTEDEYINWTIDLFDLFEHILVPNGVILYNINYGAENNVNLLWNVISDVIRYTDFMIADQIIWKKSSAYPNCMSSNKLTRIFENVFVFVRKSEYDTFQCAKEYHKSTGRYGNIFNFIEARNNDGSTDLNKATFSSEFACKLLKIYAKKNNRIYDPFIGTGTTGVACEKLKSLHLEWCGSELSKSQVDYANERLSLYDRRLF